MNKSSLFNTLNAISTKLSEIYDINIYIKNQEQGFIGPCFFIFNIGANQERIGSKRYRREQEFSIHFFPENKDDIKKCLSIAENLYFDLEYININKNLTRGTSMRHTISNNMVKFYVNYNFNLIVEKDEPLMRALEQNVDMKI